MVTWLWKHHSLNNPENNPRPAMHETQIGITTDITFFIWHSTFLFQVHVKNIGVNVCRTFVSGILFILELAGTNLVQTLLISAQVPWH